VSEGIDSIGSVGSITSGDVVSNESTAPSSADGHTRAAISAPVTPNAADQQTSGASASSAADAAGNSNPPSLQEAVDTLNARLASADRVLELRVDAASGITIAEIKNASTGQVLRQMPGEDLVRLAQMLHSWSGGKSLLDLIA
jgi:flagellar protein FlaG